MNEHLSAYLNDHLAVVTSGIDLLQFLREQNPQSPLAAFALDMAAELREDRTFLQNIIDRVGQGPSAIKQAAGWLGARLNEAKFTPDAYGTFKAMESLSLDIEGKLLMWQILMKYAGVEPVLQNMAFDNLIERAKKQRAQVEVQRVIAAQAAFQTPASTPPVETVPTPTTA